MQLTKEQEKEIIRVCGENFEPSDVPAYWRDQYFDGEMKLIETLEREAEEIMEENTSLEEKAEKLSN